MSYFVDINTLILNFIWKDKSSRIPHTILEKNKVVRLTLANINSYYKAPLSRAGF